VPGSERGERRHGLFDVTCAQERTRVQNQELRCVGKALERGEQASFRFVAPAEANERFDETGFGARIVRCDLDETFVLHERFFTESGAEEEPREVLA